jgi:alpha-L-glutamate ligase-related protein
MGILGMNRRNISYISAYNPRYLMPLVDDKLKTKQLALEHDVPVPEMIGVVDSQPAIKNVELLLRGQKSFCIKPAKGSGGKGILVIIRVEEGRYYRSNGQPIELPDIQRHLSNILAGLFSLGGAMDVAIVEGLIVVDPFLAEYSYEGVPDIRLIVFRGVPVMSMMRLSCAVSQGKANLHQGAVGVGIDVGSGRAVNAVQRDHRVSHHPDTGCDLMRLAVPRWQELLELGCACSDMTGLGYLGVDLVLDANQGPVLLELNARPGLSIQIANHAGLLPRLREIEKLKNPARMSVRQRIDFARRHFSAEPLAPVAPSEIIPVST